MKPLGIIFLLVALKVSAVNVEYLSGNISYSYVSGSCPSATRFQIDISLCTNESRTKGDSVLIYFGDGVRGYAKRTDSIYQGNRSIISNYRIFHTYPSCGDYSILYFDTVNVQQANNRNGVFYISSQIYLRWFVPPSSLYTEMISPVTTIFKNQPFSFNPTLSTNNLMAYDSISHSLISKNTSPNRLYVPDGVTINRQSGEIQWANPDTVGEYIFIIDSKMYQEERIVGRSQDYHKFSVINQTSSFTMDSINKVPVNENNFKEIHYTAGNTYSFSAVYADAVADSVKLFAYPIDFFNTAPAINITKNTIQKNTLDFLWQPVTFDERLYPYNFVLNARSYYPNDSVANSYQTVSFRSSRINGVENHKSTSLSVYPNPTTSILHIPDKQNQLQYTAITISNNIGQTVLQMPYSSSIDVTGLAPGCYLMSIISSSKSVIHAKFMKE